MKKRTYDVIQTIDELVWFLGEDEFKDEIVNYFSSDELRQFCDFVIRMQDLCNDFDDDGKYYGYFKD